MLLIIISYNNSVQPTAGYDVKDDEPSLERRQQAALCAPTFSQRAAARPLYSAHSVVFVMAHTAPGAAGEEAVWQHPGPLPSGTRAAL